MLYPLNDVVSFIWQSTWRGYTSRGPAYLYSERLEPHKAEILDDGYERHVKRCETRRYSIQDILQI